ncbi:zinc-binding dehydrogenase [Hoeflea sp.]|uniref:zinc-binding dehydrogenase n=1 Tax=Hoeflea sp. TaxID=1940281 RepID=UPI0019974CC2|nr:zinc-binding dehydrogenase [Hoeflea sp.]MBC7283135.1 zinc-binding dehydrogenase [Hoeflea sp.]
MVRVVQSAVIDAPLDEVWRLLRDFNSHDQWHPAIAESRIEDGHPADMVGAVRSFSLTDGGRLREQLLRLNDRDHELTYCLLEAPLPLYGYVAKIKLRPVTETGQTFWQWESSFTTPKDQQATLSDLVANGIYRAGMRALEAYLSTPAPRPAHPGPAVSPRITDIASPDTGDTRQLVHVPQVTAGSGETMTSDAIVMDRHGGPEVLQLRQVKVPAPGPGQVRIRQSFVGVNFIDVYCRTGYFDLLKPPGVPGMEAAGTVESVGPGVAHLSPGDRVAYACGPVGAYTACRTMDAELVVPIPVWFSDEIAAAGLLKGVSAGFLLHDVHSVQPGQHLVIHAAAGGVGSLVVQWARAISAHVIATVSNHDKAQRARQLGAHDVIIGRGAEFVDAVMDITQGRGANVIYDAIGRDSFDWSIAALAIRGHLVSFGQASGPIGEKDIGGLASKSVTLSRPNYGHYTGTRAEMQMQSARLFDALERGYLKIDAPTVYPLADAARAHDDLENSRTTGSIVLKA